MSYSCQLREQEAKPTLSVRTRTSIRDLPKLLGETYGAIARYLGQLGKAPAGPPFVAYYNMDMQDLDIEIGMPVPEPLPGQGDIEAGEIPAGQLAACVHTGPYEDIAPAYEALSAWMAQEGYEPTGVAYEVYLNDPGDTPPDELRTEVFYPLKED